jgi:putative transposase
MIIETMKEKYPLTWLAEIAGIHRTSFYKWTSSKGEKCLKLEKESHLKEIIQSIHLKHKQYGYPRMKIALKEEGFFVNHKKVYSSNERNGYSIDY